MNIRMIYKKEIKSFIESPQFYLFASVFLLLCGFFYVMPLFLIKQANFNSLLEAAPIIMIFFIPALSMKSFSEEFKNNTIEILLTFPLSELEITLSKYLSIITAAIISILPLSVYAIALYFLSTPDTGHIIGFFISLIFLALFLSSIGIFSSTYSENQIISFILAFIISFFFFITDKISIFIPISIQNILSYISFETHMEDMAKGVISIKDIVYFLSLICLFLKLTEYKLKIFRGTYKNSKYGVIAILLITISVNLIFSYIPYKIDLTQSQIYTLSKSSKKIIESLDDNLLIDLYYSKQLPSQIKPSADYTLDFLKELAGLSKKVKLRIHKLNNNVEDRRKAIENYISPVRFDIVSKEKFEQSEGFLGLTIRYLDKKEVISFIKDTTTLEYDIISRIKSIVNTKKPKLYLINDYGFSPYYLSPETFEKLNQKFDFKMARLSEIDKSSDTFTFALIGPQKPIAEKDLFLIQKFLYSGNNLLLALDVKNANLQSFSAMDNYTGVERFLEKNGIKILNYLILDKSCQTISIATRQGPLVVSNIVNYPFILISQDLNRENPITREISNAEMPFSTPILISTNTHLNIETLIRSSRYSWIKTNKKYHTINPFSDDLNYEEGDEKGPFVISLIASGKFHIDEELFKKYDKDFNAKENKESKIALFTNSKFIYYAERNELNEALFLNALDYLTQDTELISIRSKLPTYRPIKEINDNLKLPLKIALILFPLILIISYAIFNTQKYKKRIELYKDNYGK